MTRSLGRCSRRGRGWEGETIANFSRWFSSSSRGRGRGRAGGGGGGGGRRARAGVALERERERRGQDEPPALVVGHRRRGREAAPAAAGADAPLVTKATTI